MKLQPKYFFTDVFCQEKYSGNQLATFVNCNDFTAEEMQKIAREINFSETTFITYHTPENNGYNVRIFTPVEELDFAGHPTLGTAYVIRNFVTLGKPQEVILNLKVGQISVIFDDGKNIQFMKQMPPSFGAVTEHELMAGVLGLSKKDLDENNPVQEVSTGLPITIVPLKELSALQRIKINKELYEGFIKDRKGKGIFVFAPQGYAKEQDLSARMFVEYLGIPEDPATGSANGCLAGYLIENNYYQTDNITKTVGQGYEIGRPSTIYIKAVKEKDIQIQVGGKVVKVAEGFWE